MIFDWQFALQVKYSQSATAPQVQTALVILGAQGVYTFAEVALAARIKGTAWDGCCTVIWRLELLVDVCDSASDAVP